MRLSIKPSRGGPVALFAAAVLAGCGGSSGPAAGAAGSTSTSTPTPTSHSAARRGAARGPATPARPPRLSASLAGRLPAPVQAPATTALAGSAVLVGGLDRSDVSVADITRAGLRGAQRIGSLPVALHDAAAATLGGNAYVIGGGEPSHDEITKVAPGTSPVLAGRLPVGASDVAAATIGSTVYVVGGYDGAAPLRTIVAWSGAGVGRIVAMLPHPVRYAAVAADAGRLIIAGGTSGVSATNDVYSFDPASGQVRTVARLPRSLTHAAAITLGGIVYVIGGRGSLQGTQVSGILAIDPATRRVTGAGSLPVALSDAGAAPASVGGALVVGGRESSGGISDRIYRLRVAPR